MNDHYEDDHVDNHDHRPTIVESISCLQLPITKDLHDYLDDDGMAEKNPKYYFSLH